jgi:diacylglycerol kinase (ATP)
MERVLVFANPIAGRGRGGAIAGRLVAALRGHGYQAELLPGKARSAAAGPQRPIRAAIIIGGDGTLRTVAQSAIEHARTGLADQHQRPAASDDCVPYPLLIVPMGTANLMGKNLGIEWDDQHLERQVIDTLEHGQIIHRDVAQTAAGIFLLVAGVGFDAWVVHELDRLRTGPIRMTDYVRPAIKAATMYQFPELEVEVDGRRIFGPTPGLAMVGNVAEYGTGFPILPQARADDQLLDVCALPCSSRMQRVKLFLLAAAGEHLKEEGVAYAKGRHVRISSPQPVPVQMDGEPAGLTPVEMDLLPGRIPFIVPAAR